MKIGFFKKMWYSIYKAEKYPDMAAKGFKTAIEYLVIIVVIVALVMSVRYMYKTFDLIGQGIDYLKNGAPDFSYKEGKLNVDSENEIIISENDNPVIGETIIDTKTEDEQTINKYTNSITKNGRGMVILKDKVIIKSLNVSGTIIYAYNDLFGQMQITEFTKKSAIENVYSNKMISLYICVFLTVFIMNFVIYFLTAVSNALIVSVFGYITSIVAKIKMRYIAIFNMSIYALTLSSILNILYVAINIFTEFNMKYFNVMYLSVAVIYLASAILILKSDLIKKQLELMKIAEVEEVISKEQEEKEQEEKKEKEKEDRRKKDKEDEENEDNGDISKNEPEGSNA